MRQDVTRLSELIEPVVRRMGFELWGIEYRQQSHSALLRVYIDKPEGVTLDDCSLVSHQISGLLDVEECIQTRYMLEVSSPGMDRLLMRPEHFRASRGAKVRVRLNQLIEGRRKLVGTLVESDDASVLISEEGESSVRVPMTAIESVRLDPKF